MKKQQPIGILGGTFDPIHEGHIAIANHVLHTFELARIEFIPCFQPPHRDQPLASAEHRLAMVRLAVQNHPQLMANDIEIQRKGISYTVDTLLQLRKTNKESPLCLILGDDAFLHFNHWHAWEKIFELAHLIIVSRPQKQLLQADWLKTVLNQRQTTDKKSLHDNNAGCIYFENINPIAISATQIREDILSGKREIAGLAKAVQEYIALHDVY